MIYDSIRQAKSAVRNTFGPGRFNKRINFYFFEANRLSYIQRKNLYNLRFVKKTNGLKQNIDYIKLSYMETTLFSYRFFK